MLQPIPYTPTMRTEISTCSIGYLPPLFTRERATELKLREFEIKSKNSKLSVIDKLYVNGGLLFKKAVCRDSRQGVGYKVTE